MSRLKKDEYIAKFGEEAWKAESKRRYELSKEYSKEYRKEHSNEIKQYQTEYRKKNKEHLNTYFANYYKENKEKKQNTKRERNKTKEGRAKLLLGGYKCTDKQKKTGDCSLSYQWIIEHIFNSSCIYCGETDWLKLGCDRINNDLPHTTDNCVCACWNCNNDRQHKMMSVEEYIKYKKSLF